MRILSIILLLVFYLWPSLCDNQQTCQEFIHSLLSKYPNYHLDNLSPQEVYYVQYSGRAGAYDFGQRKLCEAQPSMAYYVLIQDFGRAGDLNFQVESGLCIIRECTPDFLRQNNSYLIDNLFYLNNFNLSIIPNLNQANHNLLELDMKLFNWTIKGELFDIYAKLPKTPYFWLSTSLHILLISTMIVCTIYAALIRTRRHTSTHELSPPQDYKLSWLVNSFDAYAGLKTLMQTAKEQKLSDQLAIFGFWRIIGMLWILLTHSMLHLEFTSRNLGQPLTGLRYLGAYGYLGVEFFFFMGGFLAVCSLGGKFLNGNLTPSGLFHYLKHRWIRIWPTFIMALFFYWLVVPYLISGPMVRRYTKAAAYCEQIFVYKAMLADTNYIQGAEFCAQWMWYLNVDMQVYIFVIVVVFLYAKSSIAGYLGCLFCFYCSYTYAFFTLAQHEEYYLNTKSRAHEIFMGVLFGMHYFDYAKKNYKTNFYWLLERIAPLRYVSMLCGFCLFINAFYYSVENLDWIVYIKLKICTALCLIATPACTNGQFWPREFYNWRLFQILGKLTFGVFLLHIPILEANRYTMNDLSPDPTTFLLIKTTLVTWILAYFMSAFYYCMIERPILMIEGHFNKKKPMLKKKEEMSVEVQKQEMEILNITQSTPDLSEKSDLVTDSRKNCSSNDDRDLAVKMSPALRSPPSSEIPIQASADSDQITVSMNKIGKKQQKVPHENENSEEDDQDVIDADIGMNIHLIKTNEQEVVKHLSP